METFLFAANELENVFAHICVSFQIEIRCFVCVCSNTAFWGSSLRRRPKPWELKHCHNELLCQRPDGLFSQTNLKRERGQPDAEGMVRATYSPPHRNKRQIGSQRSILTNFWKFWNLSWGSIHIIYCSTFTYLAKNFGDFWTYKKVLRISKTLSAWERGCAVISIYSSCAISDLNKNEKNLQFFFYQSDILGFSSTHRKQRFCKTKYL